MYTVIYIGKIQSYKIYYPIYIEKYNILIYKRNTKPTPGDKRKEIFIYIQMYYLYI